MENERSLYYQTLVLGEILKLFGASHQDILLDNIKAIGLARIFETRSLDDWKAIKRKGHFDTAFFEAASKIRLYSRRRIICKCLFLIILMLERMREKVRFEDLEWVREKGEDLEAEIAGLNEELERLNRAILVQRVNPQSRRATDEVTLKITDAPAPNLAFIKRNRARSPHLDDTQMKTALTAVPEWDSQIPQTISKQHNNKQKQAQQYPYSKDFSTSSVSPLAQAYPISYISPRNDNQKQSQMGNKPNQGFLPQNEFRGFPLAVSPSKNIAQQNQRTHLSPQSKQPLNQLLYKQTKSNISNNGHNETIPVSNRINNQNQKKNNNYSDITKAHPSYYNSLGNQNYNLQQMGHPSQMNSQILDSKEAELPEQYQQGGQQQPYKQFSPIQQRLYYSPSQCDPSQREQQGQAQQWIYQATGGMNNPNRIMYESPRQYQHNKEMISPLSAIVPPPPPQVKHIYNGGCQLYSEKSHQPIRRQQAEQQPFLNQQNEQSYDQQLQPQQYYSNNNDYYEQNQEQRLNPQQQHYHPQNQQQLLQQPMQQHFISSAQFSGITQRQQYVHNQQPANAEQSNFKKSHIPSISVNNNQNFSADSLHQGSSNSISNNAAPQSNYQQPNQFQMISDNQQNYPHNKQRPSISNNYNNLEQQVDVKLQNKQQESQQISKNDGELHRFQNSTVNEVIQAQNPGNLSSRLGLNSSKKHNPMNTIDSTFNNKDKQSQNAHGKLNLKNTSEQAVVAAVVGADPLSSGLAVSAWVKGSNSMNGSNYRTSPQVLSSGIDENNNSKQVIVVTGANLIQSKNIEVSSSSSGFTLKQDNSNSSMLKPQQTYQLIYNSTNHNSQFQPQEINRESNKGSQEPNENGEIAYGNNEIHSQMNGIQGIDDGDQRQNPLKQPFRLADNNQKNGTHQPPQIVQENENVQEQRGRDQDESSGEDDEENLQAEYEENGHELGQLGMEQDERELEVHNGQLKEDEDQEYYEREDQEGESDENEEEQEGYSEGEYDHDDNNQEGEEQVSDDEEMNGHQQQDIRSEDNDDDNNSDHNQEYEDNSYQKQENLYNYNNSINRNNNNNETKQEFLSSKASFGQRRGKQDEMMIDGKIRIQQS